MSLSKSEQARVNGARSSGPKSPGGKARSSGNSLKHGIFARVVVLNCESKDDFETYSREYFDRFQPADEPEVALVEKIVFSVWRQHRLWDIERVLLEREMSLVDPAYPLDVPPDSLRLAEAFTRGLATPDALDRLSRMEASLDRQAARAYRRLRLLQQDRRLDSPPAPPPEKSGTVPQHTSDTSGSHHSERTVPDSSGPPTQPPLEKSGTVPQHTSDTSGSHNSERTVPDFSAHPNAAASGRAGFSQREASASPSKNTQNEPNGVEQVSRPAMPPLVAASATWASTTDPTRSTPDSCRLPRSAIIQTRRAVPCRQGLTTPWQPL